MRTYLLWYYSYIQHLNDAFARKSEYKRTATPTSLNPLPDLDLTFYIGIQDTSVICNKKNYIKNSITYIVQGDKIELVECVSSSLSEIFTWESLICKETGYEFHKRASVSNKTLRLNLLQVSASTLHNSLFL